MTSTTEHYIPSSIPWRPDDEAWRDYLVMVMMMMPMMIFAVVVSIPHGSDDMILLFPDDTMMMMILWYSETLLCSLSSTFQPVLYWCVGALLMTIDPSRHFLFIPIDPYPQWWPFPIWPGMRRGDTWWCPWRYVFPFNDDVWWLKSLLMMCWWLMCPFHYCYWYY